jgi:hypothetical protein
MSIAVTLLVTILMAGMRGSRVFPVWAKSLPGSA